MVRTWIWAAAWLCGAGAALAEPVVPAIPTEAFARPPQVQRLTLSPNGKWFAAIRNADGEAVVVTHSTDGDEPAKAVFRTDNREFTLAWLHWASDDRLVLSVHHPDKRRFTDTVETRLVAVNRDGSALLTLVEPTAFDAGLSQHQDSVVDWLPADGHHILLESRAKRSEVAPAVYRVDLDTGRRELVFGHRFGVMHWLADGSHHVRVGLRQLGTKVEVLVSDPDGDNDGKNWRTAWSYELFDRAAVMPLGFGVDPNLLYVSADKDGRRAVYSVDLRDPTLPKTVLVASAERDVLGSLVVDPSGRALGVRSSFDDDASASFWDADAKALVRAVDAALPGRINRVQQIGVDGTRYVVYSSGNGVPGRYLVGDRAKGTLVVLARTYPELPATALARKAELSVTARDGLKVPVFLTLPVGLDPHRLPVVILPHGGPISMDTLDFDPLAEFIANRGYAVLQVNFRGSAGMGDEFRNAGLQRWGLEMQDDLSDAVKWLVERGTADPARVCIVGGSYGGYAALMGAAKTPDLYRCAVSFAGVSDLVDFGRWRDKYVNGGAVYERQVGSRADDRQRLDETSPRQLAGRIKAPVLLMHGTSDRSVPYEQSVAMADALTRAGRSVRFITQQDGDHFMSVAEHRLQFYKELEEFLDQQLGAPLAVAGTAH